MTADTTGPVRGRRRWLQLGLVAAALAAVLIVVIRGVVMDSRLVTADPDAIPRAPALMAYALPRGRAVFQSRCASCHGVAARGDARLGVPDLTDNDWLYGTGLVSDIEKVALSGIRAHRPKTWNLAEMPAYARPVPSTTEKIDPLAPPDIRDVIAFLLNVEGRPSDLAAAERGRVIFQGRGACFDCHAPDARGDSAIGAPNLADRTWLYGDGSPAAIYRTITLGRHGVCPGGGGRLSAAEGRAVSLYVYSLSHPSHGARGPGR